MGCKVLTILGGSFRFKWRIKMKVADMHCDTISIILKSKEILEKMESNKETKNKEAKNKEEKNNQETEMICNQDTMLQTPISLKRNKLHLDIEKMKAGDYLVQNFAMYTNLKNRDKPLEWCLKLIDTFYEEIEQNKDSIRVVKTYEDILENKAEGKMSALLTIEEGGVTKGELAHLRNFYRLGVRMMTLTWNYINELGYPNAITPNGVEAYRTCPNTVNGLTKKGIEFLYEMERLGMIIDVSHLSDAGFYDVIKHTSKPFVASHSNARSVCNHYRNMTDDMIRALANRGGVMGINFEPEFLQEVKDGEVAHGSLSLIVKQIKHIIHIGGYECVGLGSDFDGINTNEELKDGADMPLLEQALRDEGFSNEVIEAIFYKNVMRVYKEILK